MTRDLPRGELTGEHPAHQALALALEDLDEAQAELGLARLANRLRHDLDGVLPLAELEREAQHVAEAQRLCRSDPEAAAAHVERVGGHAAAVRSVGLVGDGHEGLDAVVVAAL